MDYAAKFEIPYTQYLDHKGEVSQELPEFALNPDDLLPLYRMMLLTRTFDTKAIALQRTGKLGTYASSLGQEAIGTALGNVMLAEDVLISAYREYAAQFSRGVSMTEILLYWGGDERGMDFAGPREDFPICIPIATHTCHAVGVATAFKLRKQAWIAVCVLGDGATSKGDFYESINLAGCWNLPIVFIINNNQWAISVPRQNQSGAESLAQKSNAAGFSGEQVDGNDVIALRDVIEQAINKARSGGGPTLIEALTYRLCDHTTADDASRYRNDDELKAAEEKEPISRLRKYLMHIGAWDETKEQALLAECTATAEKAIVEYLATPAQEIASMFKYLYETLPEPLLSQQQEAQLDGQSNE